MFLWLKLGLPRRVVCAPVRKAYLKKAGFSVSQNHYCGSFFDVSKESIRYFFNVVEAAGVSTSLIRQSKTFEWRSRSKTAPQLSKFAMVGAQLGKGKGMQITRYDALQSRIQWLGPHSPWLQVQNQLSFLVVNSSVSPCRPVIQNQGRKRRRSVSALCFGGRKSSVPGAAWAGSPFFFGELSMIPIWFAEDAKQLPLVLVKHHLWGVWMLAAQWTAAAAVQTCSS